jgi:beta-lactamase class A
MRLQPFLAAAALACGLTASIAGTLTETAELEARLKELAASHPGRVGICAQSAGGKPVCVNGEQRFSLQSVMKLVVGAAVMRAVDEGNMRLEDRVTLRREDLSVNIQPIADIVLKDGAFESTIEDLVRRAVVESDSAATDFLISRLGGVGAVQALLDAAELHDIRIDRTERKLQTEVTGLTWQPSFVDPEQLKAARAKVSQKRQAKAFEAYLSDPRDTATPLAMVGFLRKLAAGQLLSPASTKHFLAVMSQTVTFPDRLRAGAPAGWTVGHKTGTSHSLNGVNGVTNDVGLLTAPDRGFVAIAAFIAESRAPAPARAAVIAEAARRITGAYR